ncbi:2Fe-2S iron-sulfur cluster-binding protein, partial [Alphaproteobacteria bacterium]|nr:2Fe-2S iron-sulfur cluster-binding protein [Alphaproteobacteria bacterium]
MNPSRLKNNKNINTNKKISFYFDGRKFFGYKGDTLASALLYNNIHLVGRSFKYHRPRGFLSAGSEEPNGIVQLENGNMTEPNRRATEVLIYEGLIASSQNRWPNIKFDFGAINDWLSPFFPAGFYYKTFMWPAKFWKKYEFFIRHAAGLGKAPQSDDPHKYEHYHYHCDALIVGSGVSGLYAAEMLTEQGLKVLLVEQEDELGGSLLSDQNIDKMINGLNFIDWKDKIVNNLKTKNNIKIIKSTTLFAYMHYNYLLAIQDLSPLDGVKKTNNIRQIIWKI